MAAEKENGEARVMRKKIKREKTAVVHSRKEVV